MYPAMVPNCCEQVYAVASQQRLGPLRSKVPDGATACQESSEPQRGLDGRFPVSARANGMVRRDVQWRGQPQQSGGALRIDSCCNPDR